MAKEESKEKEQLSEAEKSAVLQDPAPTIIEWSVRLISLLLILGLLVFFIYNALQPQVKSTVVFQVQTEKISQMEDSFRLPVKITNEGTGSVQGLKVRAEMTYMIEGKEKKEAEDLTLLLMGPGESKGVVFVFDKDPRNYHVTFEVVSYLNP